MASAEMGWGVFLILLILSGGIFCAIFFPCRGAAARRTAQRRLEALHALDALVLAADHGDMSAQQQLAAEKARLNVTNNEYLSYRRALYTRLTQNGDAFAEYQLGEDARVCLRQPRAAYDHYYRAANLGSAEAMAAFGMLYATGADGFEQNPTVSLMVSGCGQRRKCRSHARGRTLLPHGLRCCRRSRRGRCLGRKSKRIILSL